MLPSPDIEVVEEARADPVSDLPHCRSDCGVHPFLRPVPAAPNARHCGQCFCVICDVPARQCAQWGTGVDAGDHCNRDTRDEEDMRERRRARRARRDAMAECPGSVAPHASSQSSLGHWLTRPGLPRLGKAPQPQAGLAAWLNHKACDVRVGLTTTQPQQQQQQQGRGMGDAGQAGGGVRVKEEPFDWASVEVSDSEVQLVAVMRPQAQRRRRRLAGNSGAGAAGNGLSACEGRDAADGAVNGSPAMAANGSPAMAAVSAADAKAAFARQHLEREAQEAAAVDETLRAFMEYVDGVSSSLPRDGDRLPASARGCAPVPDLARVCMAVTLFNKAQKMTHYFPTHAQLLRKCPRQGVSLAAWVDAYGGTTALAQHMGLKELTKQKQG